MTRGEFRAWSTETDKSTANWQIDMVTYCNYHAILFYMGGSEGKFIRSDVDGKLTVGHYRGAVPHIGEALFFIDITKQFPDQSEAMEYLLAVQPSLNTVLDNFTTQVLRMAIEDGQK